MQPLKILTCPGLPSDFKEIVMKEFDAQVALQFSQLATKRKWSISGDISTYKNNIFWQVNCDPVKLTLFGEPAQVLYHPPAANRIFARADVGVAGSREWHPDDLVREEGPVKKQSVFVTSVCR